MASPRIPIPPRRIPGVGPEIPSVDDIYVDDIAVILRREPRGDALIQVVADLMVEVGRRVFPGGVRATALLDVWVLNPLAGVSLGPVHTATLTLDAGATSANLVASVDVVAYAGAVPDEDSFFLAVTLSHQTRGDGAGVVRDSDPRNDAAVMFVDLGRTGPQVWSRS